MEQGEKEVYTRIGAAPVLKTMAPALSTKTKLPSSLMRMRTAVVVCVLQTCALPFIKRTAPPLKAMANEPLPGEVATLHQYGCP